MPSNYVGKILREIKSQLHHCAQSLIYPKQIIFLQAHFFGCHPIMLVKSYGDQIPSTSLCLVVHLPQKNHFFTSKIELVMLYYAIYILCKKLLFLSECQIFIYVNYIFFKGFYKIGCRSISIMYLCVVFQKKKCTCV